MEAKSTVMATQNVVHFPTEYSQYGQVRKIIAHQLELFSQGALRKL